MTGRPDLELAGALVDALRPLVAELVEEELERRLAAQTPAWLTVEEYAERMRTTPAAIRARLERGRVPGALKEGRRWLIPASAADANVLAPDSEGRAPKERRPRPGTRR